MTSALKLCRLVTVPYTFVTLLPAQLRAIVESEIELTLVSAPSGELEAIKDQLGVRGIGIPFVRTPQPLKDLKSLLALIRFFRQEKFDIVHSSTPKAGLLTALAGWVCGVPIRLHTYTGQVWMEMTGTRRWLMRAIDWLIGILNTQLYADSFSQRDLLIREGLVPSRKITVLADGSISGVDLVRYDPQGLAASRVGTRQRLGILDTDLVIVFVGRVTKDKGINELLAAFQRLCLAHQNIHLLLVGPVEEPLPAQILNAISSAPKIHAVGFVSNPEVYLAASDIFCLPSYREGFGSVVIEAGAMGLPAVATAVTGLVDAVVNDETGLLVPAKDAGALNLALEKLIVSAEMRQRMGQAARARAIGKFDAQLVNRAVVQEYFRLMHLHANH